MKRKKERRKEIEKRKRKEGKKEKKERGYLLSIYQNPGSDTKIQ